MNLGGIQTSVNEILKEVVNFLFNSKFTIPIIILVVIGYFLWIGYKNQKNKSKQTENEY